MVEYAGNTESMNGVQYLRLIGDARAFRQSAWLVEQEIHRLAVRQGDLSPVGGSTGWPSHSVWESLKTASHFNLAIALELRLKCFLHLHDVTPLKGFEGHCLAKLYGQFGDNEKSTVASLEGLFREAANDFPFHLVAFLSTDDPAVPAGPDDRALVTLTDLFAYMDEDVELWRKRYSWEQSANREWQHYLDDLSAFFSFLDKTEALATQMARERGIVR